MQAVTGEEGDCDGLRGSFGRVVKDSYRRAGFTPGCVYYQVCYGVEAGEMRKTGAADDGDADWVC